MILIPPVLIIFVLVKILIKCYNFIKSWLGLEDYEQKNIFAKNTRKFFWFKI